MKRRSTSSMSCGEIPALAASSRRACNIANSRSGA